MNTVSDNLYIYKLLEESILAFQSIIIIGALVAIGIFIYWSKQDKGGVDN